MGSFDIYIKLFGIALVPAAISVLLYLFEKMGAFSKLSYSAKQILFGLVFGVISIFGTECGVYIDGAVINVRDAAPLCAGLIFGGPAGILAGLIGGIERWFAVLWGAGMYSRVACSISTMLAGLYAAFLRKYLFDNKRPTWGMALITGIVIEVVHMTILFLTHISDAGKAYEIVKICTLPMVICNSFSVMLSVIVIRIISLRSFHRDQKFGKKISQKVQSWLLALVLLSYALTTVFVYSLQTGTAKYNADNLMRLYIDDVKTEIRETSDSDLLNITLKVASELNKAPGTSLYKLAEKYDIYEINLINTDNIIEKSTNPDFVGFDMNSGEQARAFSVLNNGQDSLVQDYRPSTSSNQEHKDLMMKYAGAALEGGGYVQVGYDTESFQRAIFETVRGITQNRHVGEGGFMLVADKDFFLVSNKHEYSDTNLFTAGIWIDPDTEMRTTLSEVVYGTDSYCMYDVSDGYYIIAVMPLSEVFATRDAEAYINSYMEVIVFALLFILVYFLIKRLVVDNIRSVNDSLGKIIGGNLDVTVDVRSSDEFSSLSDDINTTVTTLKHYIDAAAARIDEELEFAKKIQFSTLPSVFPAYPQLEQFDIFAYMCTAKEVGGDFYDFYMVGEDKLAFLIADVSGKGIPAAMFMMTAKTIMSSYAETGMPVHEILTRTNDKLCSKNDAGMFVTAWMGILDISTGKLTFANAGHNPPLLYRKSGSFEYLRTRPGLVLAGMEGIKYKPQELTLEPGDKLLLYTDGTTEAINTDQELFGEQRLIDFLNSHTELSPEDCIRAVKNAVDEFAGEAEQFDDITMLMIHYLGNKKEDGGILKRFPATIEAFPEVSAFVEETLDSLGCSMKASMQIGVAVEEIFVNIAHYAYPESVGDCLLSIFNEGDYVAIRFADSGIPFDPVKTDDPDITLSAEDRRIGGLGIYMVKKTMDDVSYEYKDGQNILTIRKKIN